MSVQWSKKRVAFGRMTRANESGEFTYCVGREKQDVRWRFAFRRARFPTHDNNNKNKKNGKWIEQSQAPVKDADYHTIKC